VKGHDERKATAATLRLQINDHYKRFLELHACLLFELSVKAPLPRPERNGSRNGINNYKIIVKATPPLRSRFDHVVINSVDYVNGSSTRCVLQRLNSVPFRARTAVEGL